MRNWGLLISGFYVVVLLFVLIPMIDILTQGAFSDFFIRGSFTGLSELLSWPGRLLVWPALLIVGQALLIFVSVDISFRRLRPARQIALSAATVGLMVALLTVFSIWSIIVAFTGDRLLEDLGDPGFIHLFWLSVGVIWIAWTFVFYFYKANKSRKLDALVAWMLRGSILELLIVVPCHVIVRQREDCCAPQLTAFGISTGIAVMLFSFGPSVLFLYQKRLKQYRR